MNWRCLLFGHLWEPFTPEGQEDFPLRYTVTISRCKHCRSTPQLKAVEEGILRIRKALARLDTLEKANSGETLSRQPPV